MTFIWTGFGLLVPFLIIIPGFLINILTLVLGVPQLFEPLSAIAEIFAAIALVYVGRYLNTGAIRYAPHTILGMPFMIGKGMHTFTFIGMQYWAIAAGLLAAWLLFS
jgi:hypothetical protein